MSANKEKVGGALVAEKHALMIGINYYTLQPRKGRLNGCINDANSHKQMLIKNYNYDAENIIMMTDDFDSTNNCFPSKENIQTKIKELTDKAKNCPKNKTCYLTLTFSGHGAQQKDYNGDEEDGKDETILPADFATNGVIVDDDWKKILVDPIADMPNVKMRVLMDCCHSGSNNDLRATYRVKNVKQYNRRLTGTSVFTVDEKCSATKAEVVMISGCRDNQTSADGYEGGESVGAMSYSLSKTLTRYKYRVTYRNLLNGMRYWLIRRRYTQIPQLSSGNEQFNIDSIVDF